MSRPMRCPVFHRSGLQCERFEGHEGRHQHVEHVITNWDTDQHERERLGSIVPPGMVLRTSSGHAAIDAKLASDPRYPQDATAAASALGDTCPRCGGQLEQHEGLERDYPSCPRCR